MKLPSEAKIVFRGKIFDVYQWEQKMFDGSVSTFEMLKRPNTVEVIAVKDGKILLSYQSQPDLHNFYSLFGGRAEEDEDPLATAKRELLEESGMTSDDWELFGIYEPQKKIDWKIYTFIARGCKKTADVKLDAGEKIEAKACTFEEFLDILLSDNYWGTELAFEVAKIKIRGEIGKFKNKLIPNLSLQNI